MKLYLFALVAILAYHLFRLATGAVDVVPYSEILTGEMLMLVFAVVLKILYVSSKVNAMSQQSTKVMAETKRLQVLDQYAHYLRTLKTTVWFVLLPLLGTFIVLAFAFYVLGV